VTDWPSAYRNPVISRPARLDAPGASQRSIEQGPQGGNAVKPYPLIDDLVQPALGGGDPSHAETDCDSILRWHPGAASVSAVRGGASGLKPIDLPPPQA
jgi:hypothetical protein